MIIHNNVNFRDIDLENPDAELEQPKIGMWGRRHSYFLYVNEPEAYEDMMCDHSMFPYLEMIEAKADKRYQELMKENTKRLKITPALKKRNYDKWDKLFTQADAEAVQVLNKEILYTRQSLLLEDKKYAPKRWLEEYEERQELIRLHRSKRRAAAKSRVNRNAV
ncbi:MAG: TnpV protein [Clostridia bacterium]|nr:TnpV protein [Clostridia bacterium]